jgi:hypothetical protein
MEDFLGLDNRMLIEGMKNVVVLHYVICLWFQVVNDKGGWRLGVKAKNITWYLNFFMVQYKNEMWVEHFLITRKSHFVINRKFVTFDGKTKH